MSNARKQYGLIVFYPKTLKMDAYYAVLDDLHNTLNEAIDSAEIVKTENSRGAHFAYGFSPVSIFEVSGEDGSVVTVHDRKALSRILSGRDEDRKQKRRDELSDAEREEEDNDAAICDAHNFREGTTL